MEQLSSLYNPGFVGAQFSWWIGQVADSSTWRGNMSDTPIDKKEDIPGWGYRYKVRIMGLHDDGESVIPSDQLPWCQVMYSVWGGGQGGSFQTPGIKEGMFVFGFFLDGSDEQVPIIMGVLGNNAKTTIKGINSKVGVDEVTDESSVFEPRSGFTDDGTTDTSDNQICHQGANSTVTFESGDGVLLKTISDKIQTDIQNEEHSVECPKTKNSLTSLNTHMSNFQVKYQKFLEELNDFPTAAASKDINESIDELIEKTAGFSAKSMLTTLNSQQTFLLEKLNDATAILEQEDNTTNRLNLLEKNLEGQGKLACVFGKIKDDLADLIGAAMRKNLNRKNSAPPAGAYNPSNPCETEEIIADVLANTQQQVRGGFMDALKSVAGGGGVPSLGRLGTAYNKLENLNIPSELDVASLLPSFDQSLDVGGLLGKLPPIGGFDVGQELSFDMALANTFISTAAAFTECDPPEECPETDTLTLGGDQTKKSETDPVNTDNIAKLNSEKQIKNANGDTPKVGDIVTLEDGTQGIVNSVSDGGITDVTSTEGLTKTQIRFKQREAQGLSGLTGGPQGETLEQYRARQKQRIQDNARKRNEEFQNNRRRVTENVVSEEEVVIDGANNVKNEIVIIPDTSVKKQKETFEKPTFEKVEESSSEVIVGDQSITTIETQNISTSLSGTIRNGEVVGADQNSNVAKLVLINSKLLKLQNELFDIEDFSDPRRADLIKEINKLQREEAELKGIEYDAELEDEF